MIYGKNKFGPPEKTKINEPESTELAFSPDRQMRPYQQDIIKTYITSAKASRILARTGEINSRNFDML